MVFLNRKMQLGSMGTRWITYSQDAIVREQIHWFKFNTLTRVVPAGCEISTSSLKFCPHGKQHGFR